MSKTKKMSHTRIKRGHRFLCKLKLDLFNKGPKGERVQKMGESETCVEGSHLLRRQTEIKNSKGK